jgi:hypothetical protein
MLVEWLKSIVLSHVTCIDITMNMPGKITAILVMDEMLDLYMFIKLCCFSMSILK